MSWEKFNALHSVHLKLNASESSINWGTGRQKVVALGLLEKNSTPSILHRQLNLSTSAAECIVYIHVRVSCTVYAAGAAIHENMYFYTSKKLYDVVLYQNVWFELQQNIALKGFLWRKLGYLFTSERHSNFLL